MLTYDFINSTKSSSELVLNWEKKQFPVKIEFDVDKIVMENASQELKGAIGFNDIGFESAAAYSFENKVNLQQGLQWVNRAILQNNSFKNLALKSNILKEMGNTAEADKTMATAMAASTEIELNNYGYQLLNAGDKDKAIEVLTINTQRHPKSANVWDSLGEAYFLKG